MQAFIFVWLVIPYLGILLLFIAGWFKKTVSGTSKLTDLPFVSVIIPVHNEVSHIHKLVEGLSRQEYAKENLEIIFIDDHSEDGSLERLNSCIKDNPHMRVYTMPERVSGKKKALRYGMEKSQGDLIITTDADCTFQKEWIEAMVRWYRNSPGSLLVGPVLMQTHPGFWSRFQSLEFLSLIASGAGAAGIGHPILCNGANLGGARRLFELAEKIYASEITSGDDIFLLLELKKHGVPAVFVKDRQSVVYTEQLRKLKGFLKQRSRWTFKSRFYRDTDIIITALVVLITNLVLLTGLPLLLFFPSLWIGYGFAYLLKTVVDYILLYYVATFFERKQLLKYFIFQQLIYIFYVSFVGMAGHMKKSKW